jgi:hypothetical protein
VIQKWGKPKKTVHGKPGILLGSIIIISLENPMKVSAP